MNRIQSLFSLITIAFLLLSAAYAQKNLTKDQSEDLLGGFLDGLGLDSDITPEGLAESENLVNAINLLEGTSREDALDGIKIIGGLMDRLPGIIDNVEGTDGADDFYLDQMEEIAADIEDIDPYGEGEDPTDLKIRNVSITVLVNESAAQLRAGDHYEAGWAIGDALSNIYTATTPPATQKVFDDISARPHEWEAGPAPEEFTNFKSMDEFAKSKLGLPESVVKNATKHRRRLRRAGIVDQSIYRKQDLPENFDAREKWPKCIGNIRSQGQCGSCWAFAGTSAFADRVCIASGGKIHKVLSPQYMVNCGPEDMGMSACDGGDPHGQFQYIEQNGVWQDSCLSYISGDKPQRFECPSQCQDGSTPNVLYAKPRTSINLDNSRINDIKHELMTNGPLVTAFQAYDDFSFYKSGIYSHTTGGNPGGHAVKLLGWGKDPTTGTEYWICANSWGAGWGDNGYFKIKFGDSDINMMVNGAIPDLQRSVVSNNNGADIPQEDNSGNTGGAELWGGDKGDGGNGNGEQPNPDNGNGDNGDSNNGGNGTSGNESHPVPENNTDFGNGSWDGDNGTSGNDSWDSNSTDGGDFWGTNNSSPDENSTDYENGSWDSNNSWNGDNGAFGNDSWGGDNETFGNNSWNSNDTNPKHQPGYQAGYDDGYKAGYDDGVKSNQGGATDRRGLRGVKRQVTERRRRSVQRKRAVVRQERSIQPSSRNLRTVRKFQP